MRRICDELCRVTPAQIGTMNKTQLMTFISWMIS